MMNVKEFRFLFAGERGLAGASGTPTPQLVTNRRPKSTDLFAIQPQNYEFSTTNHIAAYSSARHNNNNNKSKSHDEQNNVVLRNRTLGAMLPPLPPSVTSAPTQASVQTHVESRRGSSDVLLPSLTSHSCTSAALERLLLGRCAHNRPAEACRLCDLKLSGWFSTFPRPTNSRL